MVNAPATAEMTAESGDRRARPRGGTADHGVLGTAKLNPFGDLHTVQHLSARLAKSLRGVFEPLLRQELRTWAEPLVVQRFADYRTERGDALAAWLPLAMSPGDGQALAVFDGRFVLELLDLFFGGTGAAPANLPAEFSPAAEALVARLGGAIAAPLKTAWEPVARLGFVPGRPEVAPSSIEADEAMIVTRFGIAAGKAKPVFIDLLYPVAALKPHSQSLTTKVVGKPAAEPDARWRNALTRASMGVKIPVRSVLAEPTVPVSMLMALKPGDVIPIHLSPDVPVMIGGDRLGVGTVGTANGHAAIRLTRLAKFDEGLNA